MPYYKRTSDLQIDYWLKSTNRLPLILRGARQVGKSTLVRQVAERAGLRLVEINLEKELDLEPVFRTLSIPKILQEISFRTKKAIDSNSLVFLDEAQACPSSLNALRYFWEDLPEVPVVSAGSLLEFTVNDEIFSMPVGRVDFQFVRPFSFKEFLRARGLDDCLEAVDSFALRRSNSIPIAAHRKLLSELSWYVFVGGMPEPMSAFLNSDNLQKGLEAARKVQKRILLAYQDDFGKYGKKVRLEALKLVLNALPAVVGNTKVKYTSFTRDLRANDLKVAILALEKAGLLSRVFHSPASGVPLVSGEDQATFKILPLDIGLWVSQSFPNTNQLGFADNFFDKWLSENAFERNWIGQLAEVLVGNSIRNLQSERLHYWLRESKSNNAEVDYLIQLGLEIVPVEVKAGNKGTLRSLHSFMAEKGLQKAVRFDMNLPSVQAVELRAVLPGNEVSDVKYQLHSLPLYMTDWLFDYLENLAK